MRLRPLPRWAWPVTLAIVAALGFGLGHGTKSPADPARFERSARIRVAAVNAQTEQADGAYILLFGDSHVERLFLPELCGLPTINLGLGGASTGDLLAVLAKLSPARRPRAVVLAIGTNDMLTAAGSGEPERFQERAGTLVTQLRGLSNHVVATDIPDVHPQKPGIGPGIAADYTARLGRVCTGGGCTFMPIFAEAAASAPLRFKDDGVHLVDYRSVFRRLEPRLCGL